MQGQQNIKYSVIAFHPSWALPNQQ